MEGESASMVGEISAKRGGGRRKIGIGRRKFDSQEDTDDCKDVYDHRKGRKAQPRMKTSSVRAKAVTERRGGEVTVKREGVQKKAWGGSGERPPHIVTA